MEEWCSRYTGIPITLMLLRPAVLEKPLTLGDLLEDPRPCCLQFELMEGLSMQFTITRIEPVESFDQSPDSEITEPEAVTPSSPAQSAPTRPPPSRKPSVRTRMASVAGLEQAEEQTAPIVELSQEALHALNVGGES